MWDVWDGNSRMFSSAPDALVKVKTLHLPGGVLESWLFLQRAG